MLIEEMIKKFTNEITSRNVIFFETIFFSCEAVQNYNCLFFRFIHIIVSHYLISHSNVAKIFPLFHNFLMFFEIVFSSETKEDRHDKSSRPAVRSTGVWIVECDAASRS